MNDEVVGTGREQHSEGRRYTGNGVATAKASVGSTPACAPFLRVVMESGVRCQSAPRTNPCLEWLPAPLVRQRSLSVPAAWSPCRPVTTVSVPVIGSRLLCPLCPLLNKMPSGSKDERKFRFCQFGSAFPTLGKCIRVLFGIGKMKGKHSYAWRAASVRTCTEVSNCTFV